VTNETLTPKFSRLPEWHPWYELLSYLGHLSSVRIFIGHGSSDVANPAMPWSSFADSWVGSDPGGPHLSGIERQGEHVRGSSSIFILWWTIYFLSAVEFL
jgi:hypothetical protein